MPIPWVVFAGSLKLPMLLSFAAVMRISTAKSPSSHVTAFVWEALPFFDLSELDSESLEEAHLVCMTQVSKSL